MRHDRRGIGVQVDPQVLRAFAGQVDGVGGVIAEAGLGAAVSSSGDALPRSTTQWAGYAVGEHFAGLATILADNVARMGEAVRGQYDRDGNQVSRASSWHDYGTDSDYTQINLPDGSFLTATNEIGWPRADARDHGVRHGDGGHRA